jgi:hypothetical protein
MNESAKPWYKSATIWSNIGVFFASVVPLISTQLGDIIGVDRALQIAAILGLCNAVLQVGIRVFLTNKPIAPTGEGVG